MKDQNVTKALESGTYVSRNVFFNPYNHEYIEQLLKDNWQAIKNCNTPMDQVMLSIQMAYENESKNCKPNEKVSIHIDTKTNPNAVTITAKCVPK